MGAGLIHCDLDMGGEQGARVHQASERIGAAIDEARARHLEMLDALLVKWHWRNAYEVE